MRTAVPALIAAALLASAAAAQTPPPPPSAPTLPAPTATTDLLGTSCGEFLAVLATSAPPPNPTQDQIDATQRAQADALMALIWANGYQTFRKGNHLGKAGITRDWLVSTTLAMANICKANPKFTIYQAGAALP